VEEPGLSFRESSREDERPPVKAAARRKLYFTGAIRC
jgi:hypothetical protein